MRTIFAEYNPQRNSIDVYTSAGYMTINFIHQVLILLFSHMYERKSTDLCLHNSSCLLYP